MGEQKTALLLMLILCLVLSTLPLVSAADDFWMPKEPMPHSSSGVAVVNDKIYAIGSSTNYEYDPVADSWTARNPPPTPQSSFGIAAYQNKIWVIGGTSNNAETGLNQVYDPATDSWETRTSMPTPRSQLEANVVNGKIYLIGGRTGGQYSTVDRNEVYDPETDSWTTKTAIPNSVVQYASAVFDGKIYVIGGQDEFHDPRNLDLIQIYDPETDNWSYGAPIPNVVWQAAAGETTGEMAPKRIYVIGGLPEKSLFGTDLNQIYNPATNTWSLGTPMPVARFQLKIAVVNDTLYVMGGAPYFNLSGIWSPENYQYTPVGYIPEFPSWTILPIFLTATLVVVFFRRKLK